MSETIHKQAKNYNLILPKMISKQAKNNNLLLHANRKGRPKGSLNKTTTALKEAILEAGAAAHPDGLIGYLKQTAINHPPAFIGLLGKVLPLTLAGDKDAPLKVETVPSDEAIASAVAEIWRRNPSARPKD